MLSLTPTPKGVGFRLLRVKGWGPSAQEFSAGDRISGTPKPGAERVDIVFETEDSASILRTADVSNIEVSSLVVNDGFERGSELNADSWEQTTKGGTFEGAAERTDERSLSREYSIKQVDINSGYSREIISEPVDVTAGQNYRFGGSYYLSNDTSFTDDDYRYSVRIKWLNSTGGEIDQVPDDGTLFDEFEEWTDARLTEEAPQDAVAAQLRVRSKYEDDGSTYTDVYWDDMFIEPVN